VDDWRSDPGYGGVSTRSAHAHTSQHLNFLRPLLPSPDPDSVVAAPIRGTRHGSWTSLAVAAVYLAYSLLFTEYRRVFEFNPDEGNNLIKALLLEQGQSFAGGIWSDQPPLFAYALLACFKAFGSDVGVARGLVLVTSAVLVFALYDSVRRLAGRRLFGSAAHLGATVAVAGLLVSARFAPLRVSVMIGLPSIAMLSLAMWAALAAGFCETDPRRRACLQCVAGAMLALSLAIKMFTLFVAPIVYLTLLAPELAGLRRAGVRPLLRASALFAAGLLPVLLVALAPVLSCRAFSELFRSHLVAESQYDSGISVGHLLALDAPLYCAAVAGLPLVLRAQRRAALPWLVWLGLATALLAVHNPLWSHHSQLLVVPAAGLVGLGAANLIALVAPVRQRMAALALGATVLVLLLTAAGSRVQRLHRPGPRHQSRRDLSAIAAIRRADVAPGSMVTARQIFAFYLQRPVPVQLSVTSLKRLRTDGLAARELLSLVDASDTQLVLLSERWPSELRESVRRAMHGRYELLYADPENAALEVWRRGGQAALPLR
jgi:hypothetical protein